MMVKVASGLDACPDACCDAQITVESRELKAVGDGIIGMMVIVDCEHSGVCKLRGNGDGDG